MKLYDVTVVGGGVAGLAAAKTAGRLGLQVLARRQQDQRDDRNRVLRRSHYHFERGSAVQQWTYDDKRAALEATPTPRSHARRPL